MVDTYDKLADLFGYDSNDDLDEQEYALAILMLLETFYRKYSTKSLNYYKNHFEEDCNKLEEQLIKKNNTYFDKYEKARKREELLKFNVPSSKHQKAPLNPNTKITKEIMVDTIKQAIQVLRDETLLKIKVWEDREEKDSEFQVDLKLRDFVKKIKKGIKYSSNMIYQKMNREMLSFVYGENGRYEWICYGDDPCSWCRLQEKKDPRPLKEWSFDHVNGHCELKPYDKETTKAFNKFLGIDD